MALVLGNNEPRLPEKNSAAAMAAVHRAIRAAASRPNTPRNLKEFGAIRTIDNAAETDSVASNCNLCQIIQDCVINTYTQNEHIDMAVLSIM